MAIVICSKVSFSKEIVDWITPFPYELLPIVFPLLVSAIAEALISAADLLLNWAVDYFLKLCLPLYGSDGCGAGYSSLSADQPTILRRQVLGAVGTQAEVDLLADTFRASSLQVAQMFTNVTRKPVSSAAVLEDMWLLSVANYHAGSGCVGGAMQAAHYLGPDLYAPRPGPASRPSNTLTR